MHLSLELSGAHSFSFFAFEVAMLVTRGELDVQKIEQGYNVWSCLLT